MDYQNALATQFFPTTTTRKTRYANTPFEVDEDDEPLAACSFDTSLCERSYLILDFEEGELSPCNTEYGYGIEHPEQQHSQSESLWYDDHDADDSNSEMDEDSSLFTERLPSMTHSVHSLSGEDTDGIQTPTSGSEVADDETKSESEVGPSKLELGHDQAAIDELRESLTRHLPSTSNGSAYFEMMVAEALSSLDEALRDTPVDCFEELCWESYTSPLDGVSREFSSKISRRNSKLVRFAPSKKIIDVPEDALAPMDFDWEWERSPSLEEFGYKYTIPSPSQAIGFSPRATVGKKQPSTSGSFKRFAKHLRFAH